MSTKHYRADSAVAPGSAHPSFLGLPAEIRNMIYDILFPSSRREAYIFGSRLLMLPIELIDDESPLRRWDSGVGILCVNSKIYEEASYTLYRNMTMDVCLAGQVLGFNLEDNYNVNPTHGCLLPFQSFWKHVGSVCITIDLGNTAAEGRMEREDDFGPDNPYRLKSPRTRGAYILKEHIASFARKIQTAQRCGFLERTRISVDRFCQSLGPSFPMPQKLDLPDLKWLLEPIFSLRNIFEPDLNVVFTSNPHYHPSQARRRFKELMEASMASPFNKFSSLDGPGDMRLAREMFAMIQQCHRLCVQGHAWRTLRFLSVAIDRRDLQIIEFCEREILQWFCEAMERWRLWMELRKEVEDLGVVMVWDIPLPI